MMASMSAGAVAQFIACMDPSLRPHVNRKGYINAFHRNDVGRD